MNLEPSTPLDETICDSTDFLIAEHVSLGRRVRGISGRFKNYICRSNSESVRLWETKVCSEYLGWCGFSRQTDVREEAMGGPTFTEACQAEPSQVQSADGRVLHSCCHQPGEELQAGSGTAEQRNLECQVREGQEDVRFDERQF